VNPPISRTSETRVREHILSERREEQKNDEKLESEFMCFRWFCSTFAIKSTKMKPKVGKDLFLYKVFHKLLCRILLIFEVNDVINNISWNSKS
jgi:hypothetical protein